jgi:hypothetical protein
VEGNPHYFPCYLILFVCLFFFFFFVFFGFFGFFGFCFFWFFGFLFLFLFCFVLQVKCLPFKFWGAFPYVMLDLRCSSGIVFLDTLGTMCHFSLEVG